jgi:hypothetical protein
MRESFIYPEFQPAVHVMRPRKKRVNRIPFVKTDGGKMAAGFNLESRDCTVRGLAVVAGISYDKAHSACRTFGRKHRSGLNDLGIKSAAEHIAKQHSLKVEEIARPVDSTYKFGNVTTNHGTLAQVIKKYSKGRYLITSHNHAMTIIDGVLHDAWHVGGRTEIGMILKFSSPEPVAASPITQGQINDLWARLDALEARS